jgi:hypothetical protein
MENYLGYSNFNSLKESLEIEVYFNMSDIGPLYYPKNEQRVLIKHFEKNPSALNDWVKKYADVIEYVTTHPQLKDILETNPILAVGEDYFVYKNLMPLPSLSDVEDNKENYPEAARVLKEIEFESNPFGEILRDTFDESKESVLWNEQDTKFYLADLKISI